MWIKNFDHNNPSLAINLGLVSSIDKGEAQHTKVPYCIWFYSHSHSEGDFLCEYWSFEDEEARNNCYHRIIALLETETV